VRDAARLEDELARTGLEQLIAELHADAALQDVGVLVLVAVSVKGRAERAGRKRVLDQAERAAGLLAVDHEADAQGEQVNELALVGAEHVAAEGGMRAPRDGGTIEGSSMGGEAMRAHVGDRLAVLRNRVGETDRHAEILEIHGEDGAPPYLVRWSDGHESIFVPGSETVMEPPPSREAPPPG